MTEPFGIVTSSAEEGTTPPTHDAGSFQLPPVAVALIETGVDDSETTLNKDNFFRNEEP